MAWRRDRGAVTCYWPSEEYRGPRQPAQCGANDRCDAIVATTVIAHDRPEAIEPSVIEFLNSEVVVHWAEVTLGL